jgi:hypothetical protein
VGGREAAFNRVKIPQASRQAVLLDDPPLLKLRSGAHYPGKNPGLSGKI